MTTFRMTAIGRPIAAGFALASLAILSGCVDNDYDLSKDMDLNVTIGTNGLTIPGSSTQMLTLDNLFDLDDSESSIKVIKEDSPVKYGLKTGDYVLVQKPDSPSSSEIEIPDVELDDIAGSTSETPLIEFQVPQVPVEMLPKEIQWQDVALVNSVQLNANDITNDVVSISGATTSLDVDVTITFQTSYTGNVYLREGFAIQFPKFWTIAMNSETSEGIRLVDNNRLEFTRDYDVAHNRVVLDIQIEKFDFTSPHAQGQGIVDQNGHHNFVMEDKVDLYGQMGISLDNATPGQDINLTMVSEVKPTKARLLTVTGKVNPQIDIEESDFEINDIPDFLDDDKNHLDLYNPQLYFTVTNPAPVDVLFSAILTPYDDQNNVIKDASGIDNIVYLGAEYGGQEILINAAGQTKICISRRGVSDAAADSEITVDKLGDLFMTIPSRVTITGIHAIVPQTKEYTITLGQTYTEEYNYEAVIPFIFGENTTINYMTSYDDLDTEDLDKFNFQSIELSFNAVNGIPLNLTPHLEAKGEGDVTLDDITCEVTGTIAAATAGGPSTSKIKAVLRSTADNLSQLKGISASFTAHTDAQCAGVALNESMGVKFTDVTATIKGNIDLDLNE
ncbi:MAG: hypothetical protein K2G30_01625 [Muribaculaceae bacterium]|nr:hypothetical protein [Muribaculaceae bacterium]